MTTRNLFLATGLMTLGMAGTLPAFAQGTFTNDEIPHLAVKASTKTEITAFVRPKISVNTIPAVHLVTEDFLLNWRINHPGQPLPSWLPYASGGTSDVVEAFVATKQVRNMFVSFSPTVHDQIVLNMPPLVASRLLYATGGTGDTVLLFHTN